ncbi:hypothetical protein [Enterococcus casseliflavus]|uniref:hypothetical protein n=1 Tax=Enterococcus casseliflavus TaxID=37734 RepID=UPI0022FD467F|nr:hypothetical protein [Enterococcus casseliflavus]WBY90947.1 hypothetical protein PEZ80_09700 [Enterococcus casseliflavus]
MKDLKVQIPTYFQGTDDNQDPNNNQQNSNPNPLDNFQRINPNPGNGKQSDPDPTQAMVDAFTSDLPQTK